TPSASSTGRATRGVVAELVGLCRERRCYCRALVSPPWVSRHVSCGVPVGNGVDEGLIVLRIRAVGHRDRLPVGLGGKALGAGGGRGGCVCPCPPGAPECKPKRLIPSR